MKSRSKELLGLLNNINEKQDNKYGERIILIDALNLFFRNFATLNMVNPTNGVHIGGLGGFLRSLGTLIKQTQPTQVYIIFDGIGSSNNRKNLIPEYKSNRNIQRLTNWEIFENHDDENDAKAGQIIRIIQYLKTLPVKIVTLDKVEADDIIAYYSKSLIEQPNDRIFIISSDKDYIQLINENVVIYSPIEKEYYTIPTVINKFQIPPHNFIIYKTLLGDNSDSIKGVKGLGSKTILKRFPELAGGLVTMERLHEISASKMEEHIVYARIVQGIRDLKTSYKVMNLSNPMIDDVGKTYLDEIAKPSQLNLLPEIFIKMCNEDNLGKLINNAEYWLRENFQDLIRCNK
jgi:DNA polymerase-1